MELSVRREKLRQLAKLIGSAQAALADAQRYLDFLNEEAAHLFGDDWPLIDRDE